MSGSQSLEEQARQAISEILRVRGIGYVIYVDDLFEQNYDIESIIGWCAGAFEQFSAETQRLIPEISLASPDNVWQAQLREAWASMGAEERQRLAGGILSLSSELARKDQEVADSLTRLFPPDVGIRCLSPLEWKQSKDQLTNRASQDSRLLCLFDHNLEQSPEFASEGERSGIGLIRDVVASGNTDNIFCGLLTHTIASVDDEMVVWRKLANENGLRLDQFLPLAKIRVTGEDPTLLADGIKKTMLNTFCEKLKEAATVVFRDACAEACTKIQELDVYDFDHMVLRSSYDEGEWEANTLLRILQIFERDAVRRKMLDMAGPFERAVEDARKIGNVKISSGDGPGYMRITKIRRQELYEEEDVIRHSPLQVGDLFAEIENRDSTRFVLLAQPCDLFVRSTGKRRNSDLIVPLVPIRDRLQYKKLKDKKQDYWRTHASMPYLDPGSEDAGILEFAETCFVNVRVLDLAVFDVGGECRLNVDEEAIDLPQLSSGWQIYAKDLMDRFKGYRAELDQLKPRLEAVQDEEWRERLWQLMVPRAFLNGRDIRRTYAGGLFRFDLQRVGRYRAPESEKLLRAYTQYLSREADQHDFARHA